MNNILKSNLNKMPPAVIYEVEYFSEHCFITSSIKDYD